MKLFFSIIIPVYNRPDEIEELLYSFTRQTYQEAYEILIVEDGSNKKADEIVEKYKEKLTIRYFFKENTGAGLSRNFGMKNAMGNYFIILDSDVILPPTYLSTVDKALDLHYTDFFGGPDAAHNSFNVLQKAINYSMTSFLTTGGLRGRKNTKNFQPRSFNMGLSKKAFNASGGFSKRRIGEDIDLSFRLSKLGFKSQFIADAFVYHKRRTSLSAFFKQTYRFGKERPVLNKEYPGSAKLTYWFPSLFIIGFITAVILLFFRCFIPFVLLKLYCISIFIDAGIKNKSIWIGAMSVITSMVQFFGYGMGFLHTQLTAKGSR